MGSSARVRYLDLMVGFHSAKELAATGDDVQALDAIERLRALLAEINTRIAKAIEDPEPLPEIKAQVLFELGRSLTSLTFSSSTAGMEEAHEVFDRASIAFLAVADAPRSAQCAVAAAQCLAWIVDEPLGARARRLFEYGRQAHRQAMETRGLGDQGRLSLAALAKSAYQRVLWNVQLHTTTSAAEAETAIKAMYQEAYVHLEMLQRQAGEEPWSALACGSVAIEHIADFLERANAERPPPASEDEARTREAASRSTLCHYVTVEVIDAMATALKAALDAVEATAMAAPIALPRRLYEAVAALLRGAALQRGLSEEQWPVVARALERVRPLALGTAPLLRLRKWEGAALNASAANDTFTASALAAYLERRITSLERHLASPVLSAAERLLLSGWSSQLVQHGRACTEDFASLAAPQALALLERSGASMFRGDTLQLGRGVLPKQGYQLVEDMRFEPPPPVIEPKEEAWAQAHLARNLLDFWSRAKMIREASRVEPMILQAFEQVMNDPPVEVVAFPPETPLEQIQQMTAATAEQCELMGDRILVRLRPENLPQIDRHIDHARRWLAAAHQNLIAMGELSPSSFATCPSPDPTRIERWLAAEPTTAVIVPGYWPEPGPPLNVFSTRDGKLHRDLVLSGADEAFAERLRALLELLHALRENLQAHDDTSWSAVGQALDRITAAYAPWSRALAARLDAQGVRRVVFLLRGVNMAQVPWEMFPSDDRGTLFGDHFETAWVYTLAELPKVIAPHQRSNVGQVYGGGSSAPQMEIGALAMRSLADAGVAHPPRSGEEVSTHEGIAPVIATTTRARFFLHGHHDALIPDADRLTLVEHDDGRRHITLHPRDIRQLPLAGMDCVELWACEGAAHGRGLQEHGISDDPEDLTTSLLLAGAHRVVASRWRVLTLTAALIQERFALLIHSGANDAAALALALRDYREMFAASGPIERCLNDAIARANEAQAQWSFRIPPRLMRIMVAALDEQRAAWYRDVGLNGPSRSLAEWWATTQEDRKQLERMSEPEIGVLVAKTLAPWRNPASWCGWRVTLRDLSHLGDRTRSA